MPGYISEVFYKGEADSDFVEVAVPTGTDVSSYTVLIYDSSGSITSTLTLGTSTSSSGGNDVYLMDISTTGFDDISNSDAIALVDDLGNVVQFISFGGGAVTATEGAADGLTSIEVTQATGNSSVETTDGGATYASQTSPNPGTIPCYAPGTMIDTPDGPRAVETLLPDDLVTTLDHGPQPIKWVRVHTQSLDNMPDDSRPVRIQAGALGPDSPARDLIVSPQHRILVGALGQLDGFGNGQAFAPAKSLTGLPGIRFMRGRSEITWIHFACAHHEVVFANGCASETLLFGPMALNELSKPQLRSLRRLFGPQISPNDALNGPPARPCLTVGAVRKLLFEYRAPRRAAA